MSVLKRGNKYWIDFRFNYQRYRHPSPDNSLAGAKAYEATIRSKLARGEAITSNNEKKENIPTFNEFAQTWMNVYVKNNNKLSEQKHKESILRNYLQPFFGKTTIDQINNYDIERFKAQMMKTKLSEKTINHLLSCLSKCLKTAEEWGLIINALKIKKLKVTPNKFDYLTDSEAELIMANADGQLKEMIFFALKTGVRFGELIALDWADIDFQGKQITIRRSIVRGVMGSTKSNKIRYIPLIDSVSDLLSKRVKGHGFVFTRNDQPFSQHYCCKKLSQSCRKAHMRKIGWHTFRHTFASHLAQHGVAIQLIKELLGHSDITTTMRYAHLSPSALREAMNVLEPRSGKAISFGHNLVTIGKLTPFMDQDLTPITLNNSLR